MLAIALSRVQPPAYAVHNVRDTRGIHGKFNTHTLSVQKKSHLHDKTWKGSKGCKREKRWKITCHTHWAALTLPPSSEVPGARGPQWDVLRRRQCWNKRVHGGGWNAGQRSLTIAEICGYFIGNSFTVLQVVGHLILEFNIKIYCLWIFHQILSSEIFSFYFKPEKWNYFPQANLYT